MGTSSQIVPYWNRPPIETLTNLELAKQAWPSVIAEDTEFQDQVSAQQILITSYHLVMSAIDEHDSLAAALAQKAVSEETVILFFQELMWFLSNELVNKRIILYLPFTLIVPTIATEVSDVLFRTHIRFLHVYKTVFKDMLYVQDVRANFVDGNILEPELRGTSDHTRVVKAIHLIPGLVQSGFMTWDEAVQLTKDHPDPLVHQEVVYVEKVLSDFELLDTDLNSVRASQSVRTILNNLESRINEARLINPVSSTPNRTKWLQKNAIEIAVTEAADEIAVSLLDDGSLPPFELCTNEELRVCVDAIRQASLENPCVFDEQNTWLATIVQNVSNIDVQDAIDKLYRHLYVKDIVSAEEIQNRSIRIPNLAGSFSENLPYFTPSVSEFEAMTKVIAADEYLRSRVHPVAIMLGSQLKGYGIGDADADVAVFVKPGVSKDDQPVLAEKLSTVFSHERIGGSALLFWLDENVEGLYIRENTLTTNAPGLTTWAHILLNGAWVGSKSHIIALQERLLIPYLFESDDEIQGRPARFRWLEELERDSILYRLLHKGYERFYPIESPMDTEHGSWIDGSSAFYDPNFRRIATELFLTKVFLPNLGSPL